MLGIFFIRFGVFRCDGDHSDTIKIALLLQMRPGTAGLALSSVAEHTCGGAGSVGGIAPQYSKSSSCEARWMHVGLDDPTWQAQVLQCDSPEQVVSWLKQCRCILIVDFLR